MLTIIAILLFILILANEAARNLLFGLIVITFFITIVLAIIAIVGIVLIWLYVWITQNSHSISFLDSPWLPNILDYDYDAIFAPILGLILILAIIYQALYPLGYKNRQIWTAKLKEEKNKEFD